MTEAATAAANSDLVAAYHHALWRDGDQGAIDRYWDPAAVVHMTDFEGTAVDVVREDVTRYFGAFAEIETRIEHLVAEGDRVVLHWTTSGLHVGPYGDVAATGKRITMTGMDLLRLAGGRIVECWSMWDGLSVYDQLGVLKIGA
ncbi:ester cyclase [Roseococcus sp.]|uniref:ester cyclase n=1 Tax=Roseococcus sp. TaxID=2109646 RepID=UPI003BA9FB2C